MNIIYVINSDVNIVEMVSIVDLIVELMNNLIFDFNLIIGISIILVDEIDGVVLDGLISIVLLGDLFVVVVFVDDKSDNGFILFYIGVLGLVLVFLKVVEVGNLLDMVMFILDGSKVFVVNEGELSGDYIIDLEGLVVVIIVIDGVFVDIVILIDFIEFNL